MEDIIYHLTHYFRVGRSNIIIGRGKRRISQTRPRESRQKSDVTNLQLTWYKGRNWQQFPHIKCGKNYCGKNYFSQYTFINMGVVFKHNNK